MYVTESKNGGIAIIDVNSGKITMKLQGDKSVKSDPAFKFTIDGRELRDDKGPVRFNSDGLALTPDGSMLYYKPLTDDRLYRVPTDALRDASLGDHDLKAKVEDMGRYTTTDGMIIDETGNLYLGDIQGYALYSLQTNGNPKPPLKRTNLVKNMTLLQWPDSYAIHDGYLYVTTSQIDHMPKNNGGKDTRKRPYELLRVKIRE